MKKLKSLSTILVFLLISLFLLSFLSCTKDPYTLYTYQPPENIGDGIETGSLEEVNIDKALIEKSITDINRGKYGEVHSVLIYKDGKLVLEEYFTGYKYKWDGPNYHGDWVTWTDSTLHVMQSVTKSITSACIGIAIDNAFIQSVNQSIFDYLPEYQYLNKDGKDKITIEHLLTMTSGLKWDEWGAPNTSVENDAIGLWFHDKGPVDFTLERPLAYEPGTRFTYNGGGMDTLGEILKNATNMDIEEFSVKYLFEPLGIDNFEWYGRFENGMIDAASGLKITPRDMVKIGVTFLNKGVWEGRRIISEEWVEKSSTPYLGNNGIKVPGEDIGRMGYSYSWWTKEYSDSGKEINSFTASGWGGQKIIVLPEVNTVVIFTSGNWTLKVQAYKFLTSYILPAIE